MARVATLGLLCLACSGGEVLLPSSEDAGIRLVPDPVDGGAQPPMPSSDGGTPLADSGELDSAPPPMPPSMSETDMCGDVRATSFVYYGTPVPTVMPLSQGQQTAIGTTGSCSGTFVSDEWVLSARHCGITTRDRFCVGADPARPDQCFTLDRVEAHAGADIALAHVTAPASSRVPTLEPIPVLVEPMSDAWVGRVAEAAGYGAQEDGSSGEREFSAEPIDEVGVPSLVIDGMGERGVCFGDSGGPVLVMASDGSVRVAGVLSWGDPSCVGRDRYTRVDLVLDWIESITGPTPSPGTGCGSLSTEGRCLSGQALWCEGGVRRNEMCRQTCGWSGAAGGYRCIEGIDPCGGVDGSGRCRDDVTAVWCERGVSRERDCAACDEVCGIASGGVSYCVAPPSGHNEPCDVDGTPGTCRHTSLCDGLSTPGRCPGPREVQCCTTQ